MNKNSRTRRSVVLSKAWTYFSKKSSIPFRFSEEKVTDLILKKAEKKYHRYLQAETTNEYKCSCITGILNSLHKTRNTAGDIFTNHPELNKTYSFLCESIEKTLFNLKTEKLAA